MKKLWWQRWNMEWKRGVKVKWSVGWSLLTDWGLRKWGAELTWEKIWDSDRNVLDSLVSQLIFIPYLRIHRFSIQKVSRRCRYPSTSYLSCPDSNAYIRSADGTKLLSDAVKFSRRLIPKPRTLLRIYKTIFNLTKHDCIFIILFRISYFVFSQFF